MTLERIRLVALRDSMDDFLRASDKSDGTHKAVWEARRVVNRRINTLRLTNEDHYVKQPTAAQVIAHLEQGGHIEFAHYDAEAKDYEWGPPHGRTSIERWAALPPDSNTYFQAKRYRLVPLERAHR